MAPTSKGQRNWQFAVVTRHEDIVRLSQAKSSGGKFLEKAPLAIVVMGNPEINDCWIEDCSIAAISMQYQAEELGLGSCWMQMRSRGTDDGRTANEIVHEILGLPKALEVLCVLGIGHPDDLLKPQSDENLKWENVIIQTHD
jgi:nitroreductase